MSCGKCKNIKMSNQTEKRLLCLVRHGCIESTQSINPDLNEIGKRQMLETSIDIAKFQWDIIATSTLARARQSANIISYNLDIPIVEYEDLREREHGIITGIEKEECSPTINFLTQLEGRENVKDFFYRVTNVLQKVLVENENKNIIIVSHGGVLKIISSIIFRNKRIHWKNAEYVIFFKDNGKWSMYNK